MKYPLQEYWHASMIGSFAGFRDRFMTRIPKIPGIRGTRLSDSPGISLTWCAWFPGVTPLPCFACVAPLPPLSRGAVFSGSTPFPHLLAVIVRSLWRSLPWPTVVPPPDIRLGVMFFVRLSGRGRRHQVGLRTCPVLVVCWVQLTPALSLSVMVVAGGEVWPIVGLGDIGAMVTIIRGHRGWGFFFGVEGRRRSILLVVGQILGMHSVRGPWVRDCGIAV